MNQVSPLRRWITSILAVSLSLLAIVVFMQRDFLHDSWQAYQFVPTSDVSAIADSTGMSNKGRILFFASQPKLEGTQNFNKLCQNTEKNSMVIGCYANRIIYLYDVNNTELEGIEEVTGAHEMLHAAYDRLDASERNDIDDMLVAKANTLSDVPEFSERMDAYRSLGESERINELHSIIGTEVRDLPDELESYYKRYFDNRLKTVELYEQYAEVFKQLREESEQLADTLDRMATEIEIRRAAYETASAQLSSDIQQFNRRADGGQFASQYQFDLERNALIARSSQLDMEYRILQGMIEDYNSRLAQYNDTAAHLTQLTNSLDSNLAPAPAVQ